ncbi:hypothetical protein SO802_022659 [Lithocarpus litseifolius]|uniref:Enoyl reductase (ER) domain-containing protein n=1 Tax=Lithocarpus litseifolius TaxID=425828 RepID=A0AAW2C3Z5_9ROSI
METQKKKQEALTFSWKVQRPWPRWQEINSKQPGRVPVPVPGPPTSPLMICLAATPFIKIIMLIKSTKNKNHDFMLNLLQGLEKYFPYVLINILDGGGLAEFAVTKERLTVSRPAEVSAAEAAALPIAGLTAHQALTQDAGINLDESGPQKNILITAASGGVGHYAVQLAKLGNTHVTATCGARNIDFVKSLGADEVLDYKTPDGAALKSPSGKKYDAVIHCARDIPWSTFEPNLSANGKVFDLTPGPGAMMTFAVKKLTFSKKQLLPVLLIAKGENLDYLVKLVKEGKLKTVIDSKHSLSKAEDAWAKSIDGHATGKIIVEP